MSLLFLNSCRPRINLNGAIFTPIHKQNPCQMLITGKKRPFCFVLKQEKALNRGKKGTFHNGTVSGECHPERRAIGTKSIYETRQLVALVELGSKEQDLKRGGGGIPLPSALPLFASFKSVSFYVILERSDGIHTFHTVV